MQSDPTVSWDDMVSHTQQDPDLCAILVYIQDGFPTNCPASEVLHSFWQYRKALYELDGVIMYDDRVVVPRTLRFSGCFMQLIREFQRWNSELVN